MLKDLKINFVEETSEIMNNFISICKELLLKNLKNRSRQIREITALFEALAFLLIEGNKLEKENPELYKQLGQVSTTIGAADPSKNLGEKEEKED